MFSLKILTFFNWRKKYFLDTQLQFKLRWALFVTYTIIQSIMRSEMCSLHLTHPSVHTWSSGQPTVQRPGSSRGLPVGAGIRTHNLGLPRVSSPTLYPLGQRLDDMGMSKISGNLSMQSSLTYVVFSDLLLFRLLRFFFDYEKTGRASVATLCTNLLVQKIVLSMHVFL